MALAFLSCSIVELGGPRVRAGIDPVGAGLHFLEVDGVPIVESYSRHGDHGGAPAASGATMFPWPNRVRDGRWHWNGTLQQLTVNEPARSTANHGLVRTRQFVVGARDGGAVQLSTLVEGEPGYPFTVSLDVTYTAIADGIRVDYCAENRGRESAPVAVGAHPYLRLGDIPTDELIVQVDARTVVAMDDRFLPAGTRAVRGTVDDPRHMRLRNRLLNNCYGELRTATGVHVSKLIAPTGDAVHLESDENFRWVQVFATDDFVRDGQPTRAIAIEPMTAPPDALNSGQGVVWLGAGARWSASWSLRYLPGPLDPAHR